MSPAPLESDTAVDAAFGCALEIFAAGEKTTELNLQVVKTWLHDQHVLVDAMLCAPSVADVIDLQSRHLQVNVRKVSMYWHRVEEISVETGIGLLLSVHERFRTTSGSPVARNKISQAPHCN